MTGLRLRVAFLAMALVVSNGQCLIACATELCREPVPPCHRHHTPDHKTCAHPIIAAETPSPALHDTASIASVYASAPPAFDLACAPRFHSRVLHEQGTSPPSSGPPELKNILRI